MRDLIPIIFFFLFSLSATAGEACRACTKLVYKQNKGQADSRVLFNADMQGGNVLLEKNAITYSLFSLDDLKRIRGDQHHKHTYKPSFDKTFHCHAFRVSFKGASSNCTVKGDEVINEYFNYFIGNDPSKWASRVPGFNKVSYAGLYKGISLDVYSHEANVKYDFVVTPGADVSDIVLKYDGVDGIASAGSALEITTSLGKAIEQPPYAYQIINGVKKEVPCRYVLTGNEVSFSLPDGYNKEFPLVIDPTLIFSTFSGSFADNFGYSATYDSHKNAYAAGSVFVNQPLGGYPTTLGAFQTTWAGGSGAGTLSGTDIGITKYSADGTTRIYSTYLGGLSDELPHSLIVNGNDELFIFGTTSSNNFPTTPNAYDRTFAGGPNPGAFNGLGVHYEFGSDIIITRLSSDGTQLLASTYVGGTGNDGVNISNQLVYNYADQVRGEVDIDDQNNVYVVTCTGSNDFPVTTNSFQSAYGGGTLDGVIIKMNNNLTNMVWASYLGGSDADAAYSVSIDRNDDLYISGGTRSLNFPVTAGVVQPANGGGRCDGFVAHVSSTGQQVLHSSYYGYGDYDQAFFIEANRYNEVFLLGQAESSASEYIKNAQYNVPNGGLYITKIEPALDSIIWSTSLGKPTGIPDISPTAFLVDLCNKVYVAGWGGNVNGFGGTSGLPVTSDAYQSTTDNSDFYLMVMEDDASALSYGTFFGGPVSLEHVDGGTSRFDRGGVVYQSVCAGCGGNSDFPTTTGVVSQTNNSPNCNNGVFKFDFNLPIVLADFDVNTTCTNIAAVFDNNSQASNNASYSWVFGDGATSSQQNPQHTYTQSGIYTVRLIVSDPGTCNFSDTTEKQVLVLASGGTNTIPPVTICSGQSVQIGVPPASDSSVTYLWSPSSGLSEIDVSNPFASPAQTTQYQLLLGNGACTDTFIQRVVVSTDDLVLTSTGTACVGDTIVLSVTSTAGNSFATYNWAPAGLIVAGASTANPLAVVSSATVFTVTVTTQQNCVFTDSLLVTVTGGAIVEADFNLPPSGCVPYTAQFVNSSTAGPGATYEWYFGDGATSLQQSPQHTYVAGGLYDVTLIVRDNNSCNKADTVTKQLVLLNDSTLVLPSATVCFGSSVQIGFVSSDTSLTFQWQPPATLSNNSIANPVATPADTTLYLLVVSNGICSDSIYQQVNVVKDLLYAGLDTLVCAGSVVRLSASHTNTAVPLQYNWSPDALILSGDTTATPVVNATQPAILVVTATNSFGCTYTDSVEVAFFPSQPDVAASAEPDTIRFGQTSQLLADSSNATWLMWLPDSTLSALNIVDPVARPRRTQYYIVEVRDENNCAKTDTVWIYTEATPCEQSSVYVPNAFSPNADGKNDVLYVRANNVTQLYFAVYDRWGQRMFETRDITKGWDGTFKGKQIDPAVFGWYAEGLCDGGKKFELKGNVTLIR